MARMKISLAKTREKNVALVAKTTISVAALAGIIVHALFPDIILDEISIAFFIIALLPWLTYFLEELELPGWGRVRFRKLEALRKEIDILGFPTVEEAGQVKQYSFQKIGDSDRNLALAGLRIEIEKALIEFADHAGIGTRMQGLGRLIQLLADKKYIAIQEGAILKEMIDLLNMAIHGREIEEESYAWAMDNGMRVLKGLESKLTTFDSKH
jgi:hypothetical protein